ncbi:hypothetical protein LCGC14_2380470, partial [marine sediment metagenome]
AKESETDVLDGKEGSPADREPSKTSADRLGKVAEAVLKFLLSPPVWVIASPLELRGRNCPARVSATQSEIREAAKRASFLVYDEDKDRVSLFNAEAKTADAKDGEPESPQGTDASSAGSTDRDQPGNLTKLSVDVYTLTLSKQRLTKQNARLLQQLADARNQNKSLTVSRDILRGERAAEVAQTQKAISILQGTR